MLPKHLGVIKFRGHDPGDSDMARGKSLADEVVKLAAKEGKSLPFVHKTAIVFSVYKHFDFFLPDTGYKTRSFVLIF